MQNALAEVATEEEEEDPDTDMPPGTDCPYPIRILAFFEMIRPYHVVIRI